MIRFTILAFVFAAMIGAFLHIPAATAPIWIGLMILYIVGRIMGTATPANCPHCGKKVKLAANTCHHCGQNVMRQAR